MRPNPLKHKLLAGAISYGLFAFSTAAPDEKFAREYAAKGFRLICFGTDVGLLQSALTARIQAMRG